MATKRQIAANRKNARKGGPKTAKGKAVSSLNARKHGIFASALTEYDDKGLHKIHEELAEWIKPVGPVEAMLTEMVALNYLRLQRCVRAEAEYHIETWEPKMVSYELERWAKRQKNGQHASWFSVSKFKDSVALFGRYNTTLTNQVVKLLHELERLRRMRTGEGAPPPIAADVTVSADEAGPPADALDRAEESPAELPQPVDNDESRNEPNMA